MAIIKIISIGKIKSPFKECFQDYKKRLKEIEIIELKNRNKLREYLNKLDKGLNNIIMLDERGDEKGEEES